MLAFENRFHGHGSLRYVYKNGIARRSRLFTVKSVANARRKSSRFSVVVSKKVLKSAVKRNRARRRIYEVIRLEIPSFGGVQDVAVIVSSGEVLDLPHADLKMQLTDLFRQAGLYDHR